MNSCVEKLTKSFEMNISKLIEEHRQTLSEVSDRVSKLETHIRQLNAKDSVDFSRLSAVEPSSTWSGMVTKSVFPNNAPTSTFSKMTHGSKIVKGSKLTGNIKSVPRPAVVFVGRLMKDTPEADVVDYLNDSGIPGAKCIKLLSKDPKREFFTSAFRVSCDEKFKDNLLNESSWPAGAEVREWVFSK